MTPSRTRKTAAVAGVVVGCVLAGLLVSTGLLSRPPSAAPAAADFIEAYRRSREGTYVVDAEFTRTMADGREMSSAAIVAQRPPDRVRRQLGSASGRLGDRWLNCSTAPNGQFQCALGGEVAPYEQETADDVDAMRTYVEGASPAYSVTPAGRGCFELRRLATLPDPAYGDYTRMCFDAATGAIAYLEIRRDGGSTDRLRAFSVRPQVTDVDLAVDADDRFDPTVQDPG